MPQLAIFLNPESSTTRGGWSMGAYLRTGQNCDHHVSVLALVLASPFLVVVYRRYGAFSWWRAVVIYSFVFYLLSAYFLIILPLPSRAAVAQFTGPKYNLEPFMALRYFVHTTVFVPTNPHARLAALKQSAFIQPFFNVVLTIPFGFTCAITSNAACRKLS